MDEMSQQEADVSQQTLETESQDGQEPESQMDTSTGEKSMPQCSAPIPKQPKMHHEENPVSSTTHSHVPKETEKDSGPFHNGNEAVGEESAEAMEIQLLPEKDVAQEKLEEGEGLEKVKEGEGLDKLKEGEGPDKVKEEEGLEKEKVKEEEGLEKEKVKEEEGLEKEKVKEGEGLEKVKEGEGLEKVKEGEGLEKVKEGEGLEKVKEGEGLEKVKEEEGLDKLKEGEGLEKVKEEEGLDKLKEGEGMEKLKEGEGHEKFKQEFSDSDMDVDEEDGVQFPKTLAKFMYAFNKEGRLRHIENEDQGFKFDVRKNNHQYNQMHYEALGEVITEHIYELLETEAGLKKVYLDDNENEESGFVFMSENALTTTDKLLILIHGSGVVRAGQWARRLIINDCLDSGTQIPYIQRAKKEGYEVLVMNTNDNSYIASDGRRLWKTGSSSPNDHGLTVWDKFVANTPVQHVAIVAHSYGGVVTLDLATNRMESFGKVFAIAFTDSVHYMSRDRMNGVLHSWFVKNAVNWVSSNKPLETLIDDAGYDCMRVSAGTTKHEETSHFSIDSIFRFLATKEDAVKNVQPLSPPPEVAVPEIKETSEEVRKDEETEQKESKDESSQGQETEIGPADTQV